METKHSAGPWIVCPEEHGVPYLRIRGTVIGKRYKIANVLLSPFCGSSPCASEDAKANARLIAAAPELLGALKNARSAHLAGQHLDLREMGAAIGKATGRAA